MKFKKNIAFLFGILAFISYFSFRNLPESEVEVMKVDTNNYCTIYLKKQNLLVPMSIPNTSKDVQSFVQLYIDYLCGHKKVKNASAFDCDKVKLENASLKDNCLTLQFNSALLELKQEDELSFLQSLMKMMTQIKGVEIFKLQVHNQTLTQLRHGTLIPESIHTNMGMNSLVNQANFLHQSEPFIVYRLLKEEGKTYYVPIELRLPKALSTKEKLNYIVSSATYHTKLQSPFKENDAITCDDTSIHLKMKTLENDPSLRETIINIISLSLKENGLDKVIIKEFDKTITPSQTSLNPAEF